MRVVEVAVAVPPGTTAAFATVVTVEIRDVTRADAPSTVAGAQRAGNVVLAPGAELRFRVPVAEVDPRASYTVRVHVDVDGDGRVSTGDLITTVSHPVLTHGAPDAATVTLTPVHRE